MVAFLRRAARTIATDRSGVTALEYGVLAAGILVVIIGLIFTIGSNLSTLLSTVSASL